MFPLTPTPPPVRVCGPARSALTRVADAVRAERRRTLDVRTAALRLSPAGLLHAGTLDGLSFEEHGLRTFLGYYTAAFPRACPYVRTLPGRLAAPLFAHSLKQPGLPAEVRLRIRGPGDGGIFATVPPSYAPYDVDAVLDDIPADPGGLACVTYDPGDSSIAALLYPPGGGCGVEVRASDDYAGGIRVSVLDVGDMPDGPAVLADYGDPLPGIQRRKRGTLDDGMGDLLAAKFAAAPEWHRFRSSPSARVAPK